MKISLVGLAEGVHHLHFEEQPASCGIIDHPNLFNPVHIEVDLEKRAASLFLRNRIETVGRFHCDRCLKEVELTITDIGRVIFSNDEELRALAEDEVHPLAQDAREVDITDDLRDLLLLAIPAKILCAETCKGLCPHCGVDLNTETCRCGARPIDARWQALQKLIN